MAKKIIHAELSPLFMEKLINALEEKYQGDSFRVSEIGNIYFNDSSLTVRTIDWEYELQYSEIFV